MAQGVPGLEHLATHYTGEGQVHVNLCVPLRLTLLKHLATREALKLAPCGALDHRLYLPVEL